MRTEVCRLRVIVQLRVIVSVVLTVSTPALSTQALWADFTFGAPRDPMEEVPSTDFMIVEWITADGLEMYVCSPELAGYGNDDLYMLKRASTNEAWGAPENCGPIVNTEFNEAGASLSADELEMYFHSNRDGDWDIYRATRADRDSPWEVAENLGSVVNSSERELFPCISRDGLELFFTSTRTGTLGAGDTYVSRRRSANDRWRRPVNLGPAVNSAYNDQAPSLSPDGLVFFFHDFNPARPEGHGGGDVWMARRAGLDAPWQTAVNLGPAINGPDFEYRPKITLDGATLYHGVFTSDMKDFHRFVPIEPIVDFSGNGRVGLEDVELLIEHWGTSHPKYDIGPYAWGDGTVDAADFEVLMRYWGMRVGDAEE